MSQNLTVCSALSTIFASLLILLSTGAQAAEPVQLALWSPIQLVNSDQSVGGFRFSLLWGVNKDVSGFDFSTLASKADGSVSGYQGAVGLAEVGGDVTGLQTSLVSFVGGDFAGLQTSVLGASVGGHMKGAQLSLSVSVADEVTGVQIGGANQMRQGRGLQIGGLNIAEHLTGLQLGLVNINKNGFLPVFPFFNFSL